MKKGFTLIELLSVIVILAIIAAIAIPIVINIISDTKVSSIKRSSELYIDAIELTLANAKIDNVDIAKCKVEKENLVCGDKKYKIELKGEYPKKVEIKATKNGEVYFAMQYEGYCAIKNEKDKTTKYKKLVDEVTNHDIEADYNSCSLTPIYTTTRKCFEFDSSTGTITNYYDNEDNDPNKSSCPKDVVIPNMINGIKVNTIGSKSFSNKKLESVEIMEGITTIESSAFSSNSIKELKLPTTLTTFAYDAFRLNDLKEEEMFFYKRNSDGSIDYSTLIGYGGRSSTIVIPAEKNGVQLKTIGKNTFTWRSLTSVEIPEGVEVIDEAAFSYNKLRKITLPNTLVEIGPSAFLNSAITTNSIELVIPESVKTIGSTAFYNLPITNLVLPDTTLVSPTTFQYNKLPQDQAYIYKRDEEGNIDYSTIIAYGGELKDIVIPPEKNGVKLLTIGESAFRSNGLTNVVIPDTVTTIGEYAFYGNSINHIIIPSKIKEISNESFYNNGLTSVEIKEGVEVIKTRAFLKNSLTTIEIPSTVTLIETEAFFQNSITSVTIKNSSENIILKYRALGSFNTNNIVWEPIEQ